MANNNDREPAVHYSLITVDVCTYVLYVCVYAWERYELTAAGHLFERRVSSLRATMGSKMGLHVFCNDVH